MNNRFSKIRKDEGAPEVKRSYTKGDRVEVSHKGKTLYGVVKRGGANKIHVVLDGAEREVTAPARLFKLSQHPLAKDEPNIMDKYSVKGYKDFGMGNDSLIFKATILKDGVPILSVANSGWGGCNEYHPINRQTQEILGEFFTDVRKWVKEFGHADMIEPEDTWVDWWQNLRPYGVTAKNYIAGFKARVDELLNGSPVGDDDIADVYLKDEGNIGSLIFSTEKGKYVAKQWGVKNDYANMGSYRADLNRTVAKNLAKTFSGIDGVKVEMEY